MTEFADILIWLGAISVLFGIARKYFRSPKKNPTGVSTDGVLALPITGDHWIAVQARVQMPCQEECGRLI